MRSQSQSISTVSSSTVLARGVDTGADGSNSQWGINGVDDSTIRRRIAGLTVDSMSTPPLQAPTLTLPPELDWFGDPRPRRGSRSRRSTTTERPSSKKVPSSADRTPSATITTSATRKIFDRKDSNKDKDRQAHARQKRKQKPVRSISSSASGIVLTTRPMISSTVTTSSSMSSSGGCGSGRGSGGGGSGSSANKDRQGGMRRALAKNTGSTFNTRLSKAPPVRSASSPIMVGDEAFTSAGVRGRRQEHAEKEMAGTLRNLLSLLLSKRVSDRITVQEAQEHPWMQRMAPKRGETGSDEQEGTRRNHPPPFQQVGCCCFFFVVCFHRSQAEVIFARVISSGIGKKNSKTKIVYIVLWCYSEL